MFVVSLLASLWRALFSLVRGDSSNPGRDNGKNVKWLDVSISFIDIATSEIGANCLIGPAWNRLLPCYPHPSRQSMGLRPLQLQKSRRTASPSAPTAHPPPPVAGPSRCNHLRLLDRLCLRS